MNRKPYRAWLLLAAALLGQWLAIAHATQHPALATAHAACEYCVSGIGGGAPLAEPPTLPAVRATESPLSCAVAAPASRLPEAPRNRGPPASLV